MYLWSSPPLGKLPEATRSAGGEFAIATERHAWYAILDLTGKDKNGTYQMNASQPDGCLSITLYLSKGKEPNRE